jgi:hypothetical protein
MMLVKAFTYGAVLCLSTALMAGFRLDGNWDPLIPFLRICGGRGLVGSIVLLRHLNTMRQCRWLIRFLLKANQYKPPVSWRCQRDQGINKIRSASGWQERKLRSSR